MKSTYTHLSLPLLFITLAAGAEELPQITVTATKEAVSADTQAVTVDAVDRKQIEATRPAHPSALLDQVPGVHVNITGGEGHMTAIRQPLTTNPVYLYLEDGLPTRSPGFFNHNALYEVNVPQADGVEVLKGPGSSLYGSDAIGGVINVLTRPVPQGSEAALDLDYGGYGYLRLLWDQGRGDGAGGYRNDLNFTHSDGWRRSTQYDRQSYSGRWESTTAGGRTLKTVFTASNIDQQTAGSSALSLTDYENNPELNYTPISYRKVQALRLSTEYAHEGADSLLTVTPYLRSNNMDILPNWSLSYDPTVYSSGHQSVGVQVRQRQDFADKAVRLISGVDVEYSPGYHQEYSITTTKVSGIYTDYTLDQLIYDYGVGFSEVSPYVHGEMKVGAKLHLEAGLRYDVMQYNYDNYLTELTTGSHRRPADTHLSYQHPSPKLGLVYDFNKHHNGFVSYRHAFRVPSESQLFRQGSTLDSTGLLPVKADSVELGLRGRAWTGARYELTVYDMTKTDDILSYNDGSNTYNTNAGATQHQGAELGLKMQLSERLQGSLAYSQATHTLVSWQPKPTVDLSGNEMSLAPNQLANANLDYRAALLNGGSIGVEWKLLGSYWMDDENTHRYPGHSLVNLRSSYALSPKARMHLNVTNVFNVRYATSSSYKTTTGEQYAPGMPMTVYLGLHYQL